MLQCGTFSLQRYFQEQKIGLSLQYVRNYDTPCYPLNPFLFILKIDK